MDEDYSNKLLKQAEDILNELDDEYVAEMNYDDLMKLRKDLLYFLVMSFLTQSQLSNLKRLKSPYSRKIIL